MKLKELLPLISERCVVFCGRQWFDDPSTVLERTIQEVSIKTYVISPDIDILIYIEPLEDWE